jgi:hypothetical protein
MTYRKALDGFYKPRYFERRITVILDKTKIEAIPCYYCGLAALHQDHAPALKFVRDAINAGDYEIVLRGDLFLIPACARCNQTLAARKLVTLAQRREFIWKLDSYAALRCFRVVLAQYRRRLFTSVRTG